MVPHGHSERWQPFHLCHILSPQLYIARPPAPVGGNRAQLSDCIDLSQTGSRTPQSATAYYAKGMCTCRQRRGPTESGTVVEWRFESRASRDLATPEWGGRAKKDGKEPRGPRSPTFLRPTHSTVPSLTCGRPQQLRGRSFPVKFIRSVGRDLAGLSKIIRRGGLPRRVG